MKNEANKLKKPELEEFIKNRDYTGALALLEFYRNTEDEINNTILWIAYCSFHLGIYDKALKCYQEISEATPKNPEINLYIAACYYYLQLYKESEEYAEMGPDCPLKR